MRSPTQKFKEQKIIILYASAGSGHKKAAEALQHYLKQHQALDVPAYDIVSFMPPSLRRLYTEGYIILITRLVWLWAWLFRLSEAEVFSFLNVYLRRIFNRLSMKRFIHFLVRESPDAVISTQFLASEIAGYVKEKSCPQMKLITVVTDFGVHPFWIAPQTDIYCCAAESSRQILIKRGVEEIKIKVTGIPVDEKFMDIKKQGGAIAAQMGLEAGPPTALITAGGIGAGPIEEIAGLLSGEFQLLVVCGNNEKLRLNLAQKGYANARIFGLVDYMEKLMSVCDVVITKAGGLTTAESLAVGLPMIFFLLIPGQEAQNAAAAVSGGAGFIAGTPEETREIMRILKNNPEYLAAAKAKALRMGKPYACRDICLLLS